MKRLRWMCVLATLALISTALAYGQAVNATLLGTITDSSGAAVPNAKVTVTETNTGINRTTSTNESGNYTVADMPPGKYSVIVEQTGFKRAERSGLDVVVNTTTRVDLTLQPGQITETINVTSEAPALQTERADTGRKIESKSIEDLPLGGSHNVQALTILVPGAALPENQHSAFFNPQVSLATRFNGQSRLGDNLQLEGVDDNERTGLLQVLIPPQEAIQTMDISTSNFEAELGRATGGVANIILKSGTNQIHGSAYEDNRVSALSARNWFDPVRGHFTYNYFGGAVGGPIKHNRTFFFGDYLRVEDHQANNDRLSVPPADLRSGNLNVAAPGGKPTVIYDPNTGDPNTGAGRSPFPGNIIMKDRINPVSLKILSVVPLPNFTGATNPYAQNYFVNSPFFRNTDQFDVKVDHNQTDNDRLSVRYSFSRPVTTDASVYGIYGGPRGVGGNGFEGTGIQDTHSGAINYNRIFSPTLIMEARFGVNRYRNDAQQFGFGQNVADQLGIPGINGIPWTSGPPQITLDNFGDPFIGFSASLPWIRAESNVLFTNTWTKTKGNHTFKFGGEIRRVRDDLLQTQTVNPRGRYQFSQAQTGSTTDTVRSFTNSFASFLLDIPAAAGRDYPVIFPAYRAWQFYSFAQDKWVATPKLTIDIGLRWEFYPPATPAHTAGFSQFNPVNDTLEIAGVGGVPSNVGLKTHYKDFAPRLGIAYRLNDKTVVRTGFGISYAPYPDNTYAYNFPVKQNKQYSLPANCSICGVVLDNGQLASFQLGFPPFPAAVIPTSGIISHPDPNQQYFFINTNFREPYVEAWNFAVQRQLPFNLAFEVAYVGNHGVDQPALYALNASQTLGGNQASQPLFAAYGQKGNVDDRYVGYSSMYNGLQSKLDKRFSAGLALTLSYSYQKAMGMQSEDAGLDFYINPRRNWRRLDFDRTHTFASSFVYELPFGKNKRFISSGPAAYILGGWQMNGVLSIYTGQPINFGGDTSVLKAPGNSNTLNWFGPGPIPVTHNTGRGVAWFTNTQCNFNPAKGALVTTQCFAQPGAENGGLPEFGNLGRNPMNGPGAWNLDASLFRTFDIKERWKIQLKGEAFSLANTPRWGNPDTTFGSATFGQITGLSGVGSTNTGNGGARSIELGAKLIF
ncbi:MAG TPA: carboxypeptidase regulatory-like domain-containing protein [Bryobacteraceae bacterium]|nr:carboxypeptidase regulatory-like domain-containing protein [Bryobacteraceae bacterium]